MPFSFKTKLCSDRKHLRTVLIRKTIEYELTFVDTTSPQEFNLIVQSRLKQRIQFQNNSRTHIFNEILSKKKKKNEWQRKMVSKTRTSRDLQNYSEPAEIQKNILQVLFLFGFEEFSSQILPHKNFFFKISHSLTRKF